MHGQPRAFIAALLFAAVAIAVGLSAAPQLHSWLHKTSERGTHECAVTLMSSGSVEHSPETSPLPGRVAHPQAEIFRSEAPAQVGCSPGVSRLEHAPPAHA